MQSLECHGSNGFIRSTVWRLLYVVTGLTLAKRYSLLCGFTVLSGLISLNLVKA